MGSSSAIVVRSDRKADGQPPKPVPISTALGDDQPARLVRPIQIECTVKAPEFVFGHSNDGDTASLALRLMLLDHAFGYLDVRLGVIPNCTPSAGAPGCRQHGPTCPRAGKLPLVADWTHYGADPPARRQVLAWWNQWPDANIGFVAGGRSRTGALDIDPRNLRPRSVPPALKALLERPELWPGPWATTGGGGLHFFARLTQDVEGSGVLAPGIEWFGRAQNIVLPPSLHKSGRRYRWGSPLLPERPVSELPDYLRALIASAIARSGRATVVAAQRGAPR